jgi:hypothetical protein
MMPAGSTQKADSIPAIMARVNAIPRPLVFAHPNAVSL